MLTGQDLQAPEKISCAAAGKSFLAFFFIVSSSQASFSTKRSWAHVARSTFCKEASSRMISCERQAQATRL